MAEISSATLNLRRFSPVARHKAAVQAVKDFQFDESDDESFNRSAVTFIEEYKTCNPGLLEDKDYKRAYKQRIENELKIFKTSNDSMYQKLNELTKIYEFRMFSI